MKKWILPLGCLLALSSFTAEAGAWPFRGRAVSTTRTVTTTTTRYASPQAAVNDKAARCAASCRMAHLGGGYGGARAEGVAVASTAAAALANCCFSGQRKLAAQAVVRGRNGMFYAVRVFW